MNLLSLINKVLEDKEDEPRAYIGASSIGNPCERAIWYGLNYPHEKEVSPKQKLTFEIGKKLESMIKRFIFQSYDLDLYDMHLYTNLNEGVCKKYPLFKGNYDGVICVKSNNKQYILEIKTANDSSFNTFKNKGIRLWYPEYYDQVQSYMGMSGIHASILLAINKNTSDLHEEIIIFDEHRYKFLVQKAQRIGESLIEPPKINESPSYFKCKMCFYRKFCHKL
jgi:hypothetical protein